MKKILFALLVPVLATAQDTNQNYIKATAYKVPTATALSSPSPAQASQSVTYFDGLGRPIQQVASKQSSEGKDIVTHIEYDAFGKQALDYLPYPADASTMAFTDPTTAKQATLNHYQAAYGDANPFSEKRFEASPLNRVLQQAAPGNAWAMAPQGQADHSVKMAYEANSENDGVKIYKAIAGSMSGGYYPPQFSHQANYAPGQLYKTVTKDENWTASSGKNHTAEEFKDKEGKVVLKRTYSQSVAHDTYYAYDQYGNLSYVIPPLADGTITQAVLDGLCYQYRYDHRNRLVEKKLPGKDWEFIVYDKLDRVIATGPALTPFGETTKGWLISKYDAFGRVAYTGWYSGHQCNSAQRNALQALMNNATVLSESRTASNTVDNIAVGYTNSVLPTGSFKLLSVSYYDDYSYPNAITVPSAIESQPVLANVKGLATGSWTRALTQASETKGELSHFFYDAKGRGIFVSSKNHLNGVTETATKLDFSGKTLYTITKHQKNQGDAITTVREDFAYTDQDRLLTHTHKINTGTAQLLARNEYDKLGQLIRKSVGGTNLTGQNAIQKIDYEYNIRGWLKGINTNGAQAGDPADLFTFRISYDTVENSGNHQGTPLFNGNISETYWKSASDNVMRKYSYEYDALNRLTGGVYQKPEGIGATQSYNEHLSYDKNGNMLGLWRNGDLDHDVDYIQIDNLNYKYDETLKNRLLAVEDKTNHPGGFKDGNKTGDDYAYDGFGNMTSDKNKGITNITYNHLNLPVKINFANGGQINYIYDANGKKLSKKVLSAGTEVLTEYQGAFQYADGVLDFIQTAEGYVKRSMRLTTPVFNYVYNYKDHLGNVRVSFSGTARDPKIMEENHYYPFGLKHEKYNSDTYEFVELAGTGGYYTGIELAEPDMRNSYQYKYNGKEFQDELGLNLYDYGARNYDPAIGRFMNMDRLAEKFENLTPYQYAGNAPTYFIDVNGEYIYINDPNEEGKQYRYQNGVTQHQVDGKWQAIDSSTQLSDFVLNTVAGLNTLENSGKTGKGLVDVFSGSGKDVTFQYQKNAAGHLNGMISLDHNNSGATFVKTSGGIEMQNSPYFVTIGHEMAHAQDPVRVDFMNTWYPVGKDDKVSKTEIYASHYENMIRAEAGLPLRTHYSAIRVGKNYLPEPRSRLIDKMGNSVYYGHPSSSGKQTQIPATINDGLKADGGEVLKNRFNYYDKE